MAANSINTVNSPVIALDLGKKRVGVAVSDSLSISITRLDALPRTNWKQLLRDVENLVLRFDAKTLVIGLPLRLDGLTGDSARETQETARKFALSLKLPVYLQDERLTSREAEDNLLAEGHQRESVGNLVDSEAAAMILRDFLNTDADRLQVEI